MNLTSKRMLPFLTACASALALSASAQTTWVSDNFEAEGEGYTNAATGSAAGIYKMSTWGGANNDWYTNLVWFADAGDASSIQTNEDAFAGARSITNANAQAKILKLETEGQTLMRPVYVDGATGTISFATAPVYLDTLIKFTPSEDDPEITDSNIKIAIFVNVNSNLVVRHKYTNGEIFIPTNSVFEGLGAIDPNEWHRLTIMLTSTPTLFGGSPTFEITFDGDKLTHANGAVNNLTYSGGSWFFSLKDGDVTLSQVSFQGTGYLDDLVIADWTTPLTQTSLQLTLVFNDDWMDVTFNSSAVTSNQTVTIAPAGGALAIQAIDWYQVQGVTGTGVSYSGTTGSLANASSGTVTVDATGRTATIEASQYTGTIPTGLPGTYANVPADKLAAWAVASGLSQAQVMANAADYLDNYLLNVDETISADIEITSIVIDEVNETATITVGATDAAVNFTSLNGTLVVSTSDDLVSWSDQTIEFSEQATEATVVVPYTAGNFLKVWVK